MATELHRLLTTAQIPGPFLLVSHSLGGQIAQLFAFRHRDETAGLVLVDATHEDIWDRIAAETGRWRDHVAWVKWSRAVRWRLRPLGLLRVAADLGRLTGYRRWAERAIPADLHDVWIALACTSRKRRTVIRETLAFRESARELRSERVSLDPMPITVITSSEIDPNLAPGSAAALDRAGFYATWLALQKDLAAMSANSRHVIARNAGHHVHVDERATVVEAITDLHAMIKEPW